MEETAATAGQEVWAGTAVAAVLLVLRGATLHSELATRAWPLLAVRGEMGVQGELVEAAATEVMVA